LSDYPTRFEAAETTADLVDDLTDAGREVRTCDLQFLDLGGKRRFSGRVRTVACIEDNALLKRILSTRGDGAVLVIDGGGSLRTALCGDLIAGLAVTNGWAGLIINGAVRDRLALAELPIGIKALGTNPRKSARVGVGEADIPVTFGGLTLAVGDRVFGDADGVLAIAPSPQRHGSARLGPHVAVRPRVSAPRVVNRSVRFTTRSRWASVRCLRRRVSRCILFTTVPTFLGSCPVRSSRFRFIGGVLSEHGQGNVGQQR
jgi:regulator of ribonuclease activity A